MNPCGKRNDQSAFTIVEVLVSSVIFAIAAVGVFASIAAIRSPSMVSERKLTAAYYGRQILDDLRTKVDGRNWVSATSTWNGGSDLAVGTHSLGTTTINGTAYTSAYVVTQVSGTNLWQADLTVNWTEP